VVLCAALFLGLMLTLPAEGKPMNSTLAVAGCISLGQIESSGDTVTDLLKSLRSEDVETRRSSARALQFLFRYPLPPDAALDKEFVDALLKALCDTDVTVRVNVVYMFSRFGQAAKPAVPFLVDFLSHKETILRRSSASALSSLSPVSREALPALKKAMKDSDKCVRIYAATAVAQLEEDNQQVLQFLLQFSADEDKEVRAEAARAFADIGVRAIPILRDGLKDTSPVVRDWTLWAITDSMKKVTERAKFPADAIPLLVNAINDEDKEVATRAIYTVSLLGSEAKDAIPAIVKRFKDPDWQVRQYAIRHVAEFGPASEQAIPALKEALKDEHERVRVAAQRALEAIEKAKDAKMPRP
jgi:HEAT repeat protein